MTTYSATDAALEGFRLTIAAPGKIGAAVAENRQAARLAQRIERPQPLI